MSLLSLDRRSLLQAGAFGLGALAVPGNAATLLTARGFTHGVASGEPSQKSVMLWTRFVPRSGTSARLDWQVSDSPDFGKILAQGEIAAEGEHDHCAKAVVEGLESGRWYFYRFRAPDGTWSPTGRTRTLPEGQVGRFAIGAFSCANLPFGWFNAYAHAAGRTDLDLMVHLGDYLYEYQRGRYPAMEQALPERVIDPAGEIIHLADYRLRHAAYRADPDLRRLHQLFPMIAMWDDHEISNDSWENGAENHQPETEGDWAARKAAAVRAYREWMPVSDESYAEYRIGELATLFRPETRLTGRSKQLSIAAVLAGQQDPKAALAAFRDGSWQDPARSMLGPEQERMLAGGLKRSTSQGVRWQLLGQQVLMGQVYTPPEAVNWVGPNPDERTRTVLQMRLLASSMELPANYDAWDGYPAARARLLQAAQDANANLIVLTGDTHNAWAFELDQGGAPAGVEFAGQSVTSPGFESSFKVSPREIERAAKKRSRQLKWANFERRGYMTVELTPARATNEWLFLDTIRQRSTTLASTYRLGVDHGANKLG